MKELLTAVFFLLVLPLSVMAAGEAIKTLAPGLQDSTDPRAVCFKGSRYICN